MDGAVEATAPPRASWRAPRALAWALGACLIVSLAAWLAARQHFATDRARVLLIGDSVIANYRVVSGSGVDDIAQRRLGDGFTVRSFAESGARVGDYYLLLAKAELLGFKPNVAVIELNPSKLVEELDLGPDLNEDGRELMWLPLNSEGAAYFRALPQHYRDLVPPRKAALLFGFFEGARSLWQHHVTWRKRRHAMLAERQAAREARIRNHLIELGTSWSTKVKPESYAEFRASRRVRDLDFLLDALRRRNVPALLLLPPWPNQGVLKEAFPPRGRALLNMIRGYTLAYANERHVRALALDDPEVLRRLAPQDWDDLEHLRSRRAYALMGEAIAQEVERLRGAP